MTVRTSVVDVNSHLDQRLLNDFVTDAAALLNAPLSSLTEGNIVIGDALNALDELDISGDGQIIVGDGTTAASVAVSGDATLANTGALTIANDAVTLAKMANLAQGSLIVGGAAAAPTALDASTDAQILIGDGTDLNSVAVSGDITIDNAGAVTIAATAVETGMIALDAIDGTLIADDAVSLEHLDDALTPSHIVKFAGEVTWSGGAASLATTIAGVLATDIVTATFHTLGTEGTIIQGAVADVDTVTLTLDVANASNNAVIAYVVYRAAA